MYACNFKFTSKLKMALYMVDIFRDIVLYTIVSDIDEESIRFHRIGVNRCVRFPCDDYLQTLNSPKEV